MDGQPQGCANLGESNRIGGTITAVGATPPPSHEEAHTTTWREGGKKTTKSPIKPPTTKRTRKHKPKNEVNPPPQLRVGAVTRTGTCRV